MQYGEGDYIYELDEGWGQLPAGYEFNQVAGVAVDADDNVYLFNRSDHQLMVFHRGGSCVKSWDRRLRNPPAAPHVLARQHDTLLDVAMRQGHHCLNWPY